MHATAVALSFLLAQFWPRKLIATTDLRSLRPQSPRMARIGHAFSPSFSPDGKQITFVSDLNGTPQVWIVPKKGGGRH